MFFGLGPSVVGVYDGEAVTSHWLPWARFYNGTASSSVLGKVPLAPARQPRALDPGAHSDDVDGIIATGPIHCIEQHDGAYAIWRDAGAKSRVLVHIDAHHDLYGCWFDKKRPGETARLNIANFIYAALADGLVREVIWVVPDETWATRAGRGDIVKALRRMAQAQPVTKPRINVGTDRITGMALGRPVHVCTLENLPAIDEAVLLDIDVDYLIIPNIGYRGIKVYGSLPWCWPPELLARLKARGIRSDLVTIAYSVEGGYTPLQWKYLGDELAQRLKPGSQDVRWAECMRQAAVAADEGDFRAAEVGYRAARQFNPASAAPSYHLAHLNAAKGRLQEGQEFLRHAYTGDRLYRTPRNNAGWWYLEEGNVRRYSQARSAFERARSLDPQDPYAWLGLGRLAIREKDWAGAEVLLRRSLALEDACIDTHRALAWVLARRKDYPGAIAAYERSLKLALSGRRAVSDDATLSMLDDGSMPWDSAHGEIHAKLARLYAARGAWTDAIACYRMAIGMGIKRVGSWLGLAGAYTRTGRVREALMALLQAVKRLPRELMWRGKWLWRAGRWWALSSWRDRRLGKTSHTGRPQIWV
jgi:tetratricopeptide (TPR) repeat protein